MSAAMIIGFDNHRNESIYFNPTWGDDENAKDYGYCKGGFYILPGD
jgi:hypothetical protein